MRSGITGFLAIILCSTMACTRDANVNIPKGKQNMVLQCFLKADSPVRVHLSKSRSILDESGLDSVTNAQVKLLQNGTSVQYLNHLRKGLYQSENFKVKPGNNYKISVKRSANKDVEGVSHIPKPVSIASKELKRKGYTTRNGENRHKLTITVNDPVGVKNYYEMVFRDKIYDSSEKAYDYYPIRLSSDDPAVDGQSMQGHLFDDNFFNGERYTLTFYLERNGDLNESGNRGKKQVVLRTVNKAYYEFERKMYQQNNSSGSANVFSGEPVYIYDNIDNGLGVCAGYSQVTDTL